MKKYFLTLFILTLMLFSPGIVKADRTISFMEQDYQPLSDITGSCSNFSGLYYYSDFDSFISNPEYKEIFDTLYNEIKKEYNDNYSSDYPYWTLSVDIISNGSDDFNLYSLILRMRLSDNENYVHHTFASDTYNSKLLWNKYQDGTYYNISTSSRTACSKSDPSISSLVSFSKFNSTSSWYYTFLSLFETNTTYDLTIGQPFSDDGYLTFNIYDINSNLKATYTSDDKYPIYYSDGYDSSSSSNYTTVDLSKYHYVLLNLKDYSKKEAFSTNLQVKGMVGITPIYNYGTTAKDDVMGNKIEDRCNLSYKDYTDHRLYILKSDLENKAIYAIKGCEDNSLFKFDNTLFDITYVTDDNIDDPIVTIDGKEYHTIPYNQLPSTATKNEEENYVPGESKELSFSEIADNVTDTLSSVWSSIITFMNLFTKFFNTLPVEIRVISISTFTTACILGIIKILKS